MCTLKHMLTQEQLHILESKQWIAISFPDLWKHLAAAALDAFLKNDFKPATITGLDNQRAIRNDHTLWLNPSAPSSDDEEQFFNIINPIQSALKNYFRLPLKRYECHYAVYPPGHYYKVHSDQPETNNQRYFSFVYYLNDNWLPEHGGQIKGYTTEGKTLFEVLPCGGTLVLFQSHILHEVLPSTRQRLSLTGWMRTDE